GLAGGAGGRGDETPERPGVDALPDCAVAGICEVILLPRREAREEPLVDADRDVEVQELPISLCGDELLDIGVGGREHPHVRPPPPAALPDRPGRRIEDPHERDRPGCGAPNTVDDIAPGPEAGER